ncbi:MAG TPA: ParB/RepB/Spo0J family partition protein [Haloplasmataceae bacterium]
MSSRLGRGLNQLFRDNIFTEDVQDHEVIETIDISLLKENPYQPRKRFDEDKIEELAQSIKEHGVLQPIIVKRSEIGYYIIAGERRVRACKRLGLTTIPAVVRDIDDKVMAEIALLENLQREDLTIIEEATAYQTLIERHGLTQQELADRLGKSRAHIANALRMLKLPRVVQEMLEANEIEFGHAKILAGFDDEAEIIYLAEKVRNEKLSVRALEELIRDGAKRQPKPAKPIKNTKTLDVSLQFLEDRLINTLGTKVKIQPKAKGGQLVISYTSVEDLNRILQIMNLLESE